MPLIPQPRVVTELPATGRAKPGTVLAPLLLGSQVQEQAAASDAQPKITLPSPSPRFSSDTPPEPPLKTQQIFSAETLAEAAAALVVALGPAKALKVFGFIGGIIFGNSVTEFLEGAAVVHGVEELRVSVERLKAQILEGRSLTGNDVLQLEAIERLAAQKDAQARTTRELLKLNDVQLKSLLLQETEDTETASRYRATIESIAEILIARGQLDNLRQFVAEHPENFTRYNIYELLDQFQTLRITGKPGVVPAWLADP